MRKKLHKRRNVQLHQIEGNSIVSVVCCSFIVRLCLQSSSWRSVCSCCSVYIIIQPNNTVTRPTTWRTLLSVWNYYLFKQRIMLCVVVLFFLRHRSLVKWKTITIRHSINRSDRLSIWEQIIGLDGALCAVVCTKQKKWSCLNIIKTCIVF